MDRSSYTTPTKKPCRYRCFVKPLDSREKFALRQNHLSLSKNFSKGENAVDLIDSNQNIFNITSTCMMDTISWLLTSCGNGTSQPINLNHSQLQFVLDNQQKVNALLCNKNLKFCDNFLFFEVYANLFSCRIKIFSFGDAFLNCVFFGPKTAQKKHHLLLNKGIYSILEKRRSHKQEEKLLKLLYRTEKHDNRKNADKILWIVENSNILSSAPSHAIGPSSENSIEPNAFGTLQPNHSNSNIKLRKKSYVQPRHDESLFREMDFDSPKTQTSLTQHSLLSDAPSEKVYIGRLAFYCRIKGYGGISTFDGNTLFVYEDELSKSGLSLEKLCNSYLNEFEMWFEFQMTFFVMNGSRHVVASRLKMLSEKTYK